MWTTREQKTLIHPRIQRRLFLFMKEYLQSQGCKVLIINGTENRVQCLFRLNHKKALSELIGPLKGLSSHYVNYHNLTNEKFAWQEGFDAISVSSVMLHALHHTIERNEQIRRLGDYNTRLNA